MSIRPGQGKVNWRVGELVNWQIANREPQKSIDEFRVLGFAF
jgi:hypothetical protein